MGGGGRLGRRRGDLTVYGRGGTSMERRVGWLVVSLAAVNERFSAQCGSRERWFRSLSTRKVSNQEVQWG